MDMKPEEVIEKAAAALGLVYALDISGDYILSALKKAGFVVVQREPTEAMKTAGARCIANTMGKQNFNLRSSACYAAMIAAHEESENALA